ncbi:MAG: NAD-binding protein, partial [Oscillospiraceae bacterium]|nr:NAD-binding protein [Oscillospiraceae bacterium]
MKIIIVGCGKVGTALTQRLCEEGHDITVVDIDPSRIQSIVEHFDVMGVVGNGSSYLALSEAGAQTADVLIAVTGS